jgi:hypothetical protein
VHCESRAARAGGLASCWGAWGLCWDARSGYWGSRRQPDTCIPAEPARRSRNACVQWEVGGAAAALSWMLTCAAFRPRGFNPVRPHRRRHAERVAFLWKVLLQSMYGIACMHSSIEACGAHWAESTIPLTGPMVGCAACSGITHSPAALHWRAAVRLAFPNAALP